MAKGKFHRWIEPDGVTLLEGWARDGLTDEQIAHNIGVSLSTLYEWKNKFSDISDALKKGKEVVDLEVENALLKSAMGFVYTETTIEPQVNELTGEPIMGEDGNQVMAVTKITNKFAAPSNTAQIFWLKNRRPDKWRDKPIDIAGDGKENNLLQAITDSAQEDLKTNDLPETE